MLSVLIIGCGNIAGGFDLDRPEANLPFTHAGAYRKHGGFRLLACVDPDEVRRNAFQAHWQVENAFATLEEALTSNLNYDLVSICSPTAQHAFDLETVLRVRPKLVFCEKPLTSKLTDSQCLAQLYKKAGVPLMVNYSRRYDERVRMLMDQLNRGDWGRVRSVSGVYNKGLFNNGSHMLDMLRLLFGPLSVLAAGPASVDDSQTDPSVAVMLVSNDGVLITLNCGDARDYTLFELEIFTERGSIRMENGGMDWKFRRCISSKVFSGYRVLGEWQHKLGMLDGAALAAVGQVIAVLNNKVQPSCTAEDAIAVQELCETIIAKSRSLYLGQNSQ